MNLQKLDILFEDDQLVAVNKPSGLLTLPDRHDAELPALQQLLTARYGKVYTVHRLDRDTSGLILFAKTEAMHRHLSQSFEAHLVEKYYQGIVTGQPANTAGTIDAPIAEHPVHKGTMVVNRRGKASVTDYEVLQGLRHFSLLQFRLHTGRTHQIRIHCKHIGHSIVCDPLYGDAKPVLLSAIKKKFKLGKNELEERPMLNRLGLHAYRLVFALPDGKVLQLEAPLHKDMRALLSQLEKNQ